MKYFIEVLCANATFGRSNSNWCRPTMNILE